MTKRQSKCLQSKSSNDDNTSMKEKTDITVDESSDNSADEEDYVDHHRLYTTYCTITVKIPKDKNIIKFLHDKYTTLIYILLQADDELFINKYDPKHDYTNASYLHNAKELLQKMTALQRSIAITTRCPKPGHEATVWANLRISHVSDFEEILNLISFGLQSNEMILMSKRIRAHKFNSPGYFHFICNQSEPEDIYNQIISDIGTT